MNRIIVERVFAGTVILNMWDGVVQGMSTFVPHLRVSCAGLREDAEGWYNLQLPLYQIQENLDYVQSFLHPTTTPGRSNFVHMIEPILQDVPGQSGHFDVYLTMFRVGDAHYPNLPLARLVQDGICPTFEVFHG